jgi:hypothetical protein
MMETMKQGDTVYSQHGQEAVLVARTGGEYLVRPIYEDDDGPQEGDVETWRTAFRTPPAPKLDAETAEAEKRLTELRAQVSALRSEQYELQKNEKDRMSRIKQHEGLEMLDRYLAGEITHYVAVHDYYPRVEIIPIGQTVENYASASEYGLLKLMPTRSWDKKFNFSVYFKAPSPAYSRTEKVFPCCGEEDARAKAGEIMRGWVSEYLDLKPARRSYFDQLVGQCSAYGIEVPQTMIDEQKAYHDEALQLRIKKMRDELAALEQTTKQEGGDE